MNQLTCIGRVGRDAEVRHTQSGKVVTGWSVAMDAGFGDNKVTTWLDCSLWGDRGEKIADYIKKGDKIGIIGEVSTEEYEGKFKVKVNVREVELLGAKRDGESSQRQAPAQSRGQGRQAPVDDFEQDSVPF